MSFIPFVTASSAGGLVVVVSASISSTVYSQLTAQGKIDALEELLKMVEDRHRNFEENMLPELLPAHSENKLFQGSQTTTELLHGHRSILDEIKGTVYRAGLYRWSPTFMSQEINDLRRDIKFLDTNTLTTSAAANKLVKSSLKDKRATIIENYGGQIMETEIKPFSGSPGESGFPGGWNFSSEDSVM